MRPHLICFALTSTSLILSGCSSTRSISNPFGGTSKVASSASDFSEYDRDPPAPLQSTRMAAEPAPAPPARGISFSRIIDATPAGFRRAIGYGDSCTGDACATDSCTDEQGCSSKADCAPKKPSGCFGFHFFKHKHFDCFKKASSHGCADATSCTDTDAYTDQERNTCAAPTQYHRPQVQHNPSECRPRIAPPLGPSQSVDSNDQDPGHSMQQDSDSYETSPKAPGMVPSIPVEPIGQTRAVQPPSWNDKPLYETVQDARQASRRMIRLQPPMWRNSTQSRTDFARTQNQLSLSVSPLKSLTFGDDVAMDIQPLIRVTNPATPESL